VEEARPGRGGRGRRPDIQQLPDRRQGASPLLRQRPAQLAQQRLGGTVVDQPPTQPIQVRPGGVDHLPERRQRLGLLVQRIAHVALLFWSPAAQCMGRGRPAMKVGDRQLLGIIAGHSRHAGGGV
jgi:hypothetical protein